MQCDIICVWRRYKISDGAQCQIITEDNPQVPWADYQELNTSGGVTRLLLANRRLLLDQYTVGDLVGIKSKCCGHNHNVYSFCRGNIIQGSARNIR